MFCIDPFTKFRSLWISDWAAVCQLRFDSAQGAGYIHETLDELRAKKAIAKVDLVDSRHVLKSEVYLSG